MGWGAGKYRRLKDSAKAKGFILPLGFQKPKSHAKQSVLGLFLKHVLSWGAGNDQSMKDLALIGSRQRVGINDVDYVELHMYASGA